MISINGLKKGIYLYLLCCMMMVTYILILYFVSHNLMHHKASGNLIYDNEGNLRGSVLLAQSTKGDKYFKGRLNSVYDNKCDVAMYSDAFRQDLNNRYRNAFYKGDAIMITSSSSLLDPYISKGDAMRQAPIIATARGIELAEIENLIDELTLHSIYPFFQLDIVNVTILNARLDYDI